MADNAAEGGKDDVQETVLKSITRKNSTASLAPRPDVKISKANEGRSPTSVFLWSFSHMLWLIFANPVLVRN